MSGHLGHLGHLGRLVTPLVDGQLDHDTRDRAFAHLAVCASCQAEVADQRAVKARLAALGTPTISPNLVDRLLLVAVPTVTTRDARGARGIVPAGRPHTTIRSEIAGTLPSRRAGTRRPPNVTGSAMPTGSWRGSVGKAGMAGKVALTRRRTRVRSTLVGSAAVMLIALGGSAALSDVRGPVVPARPAAVPTAAVAGTEPGPAGNQWNMPPLTTVSVSVIGGR